jgi:L-seryl-tRNA(Ser) seleniumtransferase
MFRGRQLVRAGLAFALLAGAARATPLLAQANAAGEWRVNFVVPTGTRSVNMVINQQRATLSGTVINEDGEFPLKGRIADDQVTIVWSVPEAGKLMELTMKGKLSGDSITGTLQVGDVGEGPLSARRTAE